MFRDELKQPLRKKSLAQRLWAKRPGLLLTAYVLTASAFGGGSYWAIKQPLPFAGEPMLTVSVPVAEDIKTASTEPAPDAVADEIAEPAAPDIDAEDPATQGAEDVAAPAQMVRSNDAIIIQPRRSLAPAPIASCHGGDDVGTVAADCAGRRQAVAGLCPHRFDE